MLAAIFVAPRRDGCRSPWDDLAHAPHGAPRQPGCAAMKFSKLLRGLLEENPGMSDLFISYKKLKKILKKLGHVSCCGAASPGRSGAHPAARGSRA